jgi:hypothetical protein
VCLFAAAARCPVCSAWTLIIKYLFQLLPSYSITWAFLSAINRRKTQILAFFPKQTYVMATLVDLLALLLRTTNENEDADNELGLAVKQSEDATQQWMIKRIELLLQREERALRRHVRLRLHPDKANASDEEKKERVRLFQLFENEFAETSPAAKLQQWLKLLKQGHFPCAEKVRHVNGSLSVLELCPCRDRSRAGCSVVRKYVTVCLERTECGARGENQGTGN